MFPKNIRPVNRNNLHMLKEIIDSNELFPSELLDNGTAQLMCRTKRFVLVQANRSQVYFHKSGLILRPSGSETNVFALQTPFDTSGLCPGVVH